VVYITCQYSVYLQCGAVIYGSELEPVLTVVVVLAHFFSIKFIQFFCRYASLLPISVFLTDPLRNGFHILPESFDLNRCNGTCLIKKPLSY